MSVRVAKILMVVCLVGCVAAEGGLGRERRAPFSAWAGKRSSSEELDSAELEELLHDIQDIYNLRKPLVDGFEHQEAIKRAPFSSWAGKRAPFSAWAGKRAPFSSWAGKRAPFSSWAGKRSSEEEYDSDMIDQPAGHRVKRSSAEYSAEDDDAAVQRVRRGVGFSAWGGKRSLTSQDDDGKKRIARNAVDEPHKVVRPQRASFSSWGGK